VQTTSGVALIVFLLLFCVSCVDCCCSVVIPAFAGIAGCWRNIGFWIAFCSSRRMATAAASHPAFVVPKVSHWGRRFGREWEVGVCSLLSLFLVSVQGLSSCESVILTI
jgi:hypothetical protein